MFQAPDHPCLVPFDSSFRVDRADTTPPDDRGDRKTLRRRLDNETGKLARWQRKLYAHDRFALLLVFQAMDAAGKDSTIRAVLSGVNPAGCQVFAFKRPSTTELDHDFLWRSASRLPERGRIGVFNRSYYEEVLVVRVHPGILENQRLPGPIGDDIWEHRYRSINDHEKHLAENGVVILKFWLNVSKEEQRQRFLARIDDPDKNWKFKAGDVAERAHWDEYQNAYESALNATSKPWAPWYAIPADDKAYMRWCVAKTINQACETLAVDYPNLPGEALQKLETARATLENEPKG
jgi:PPK2 family polyphosphate:nucleotide phosphotransferase